VHELGTPLATMAVLTEDLKNSAKQYPELTGDVNCLADQLTRCKIILQNLARAAEQPVDSLQRVAINNYLQDVLTHWQLLKPGIPVKNDMRAVDAFIQVDSTLELALINLLNNAAEASPQGIELSLVENKAAPSVTLCIHDDGAGVSLGVEELGKPFMSTRGSGRGLGLFLSNAAIERLGGQVTLNKQPQGGTLTTVILPYIR